MDVLPQNAKARGRTRTATPRGVGGQIAGSGDLTSMPEVGDEPF